MRNLILLPLFLITCLSAKAQNYYVAVVHGEVYYQDNLIKKRDKVKLGNEIRFTKKDDYIKLSGPGGLYTLRPGQDSDNNYEFLVALRNELFPEVRLQPTVAYSISTCTECYFLPYKDGVFSFHERYQFHQTIPPLAEGEEIGYIHQTNNGLVYRTAELVDSFLIIKAADFKLKKQDGEVPDIQRTFIVYVKNKATLIEKLSDYKELEDLKNVFNTYLSNDIMSPTFSSDGEVIYDSPFNAPSGILILDSMGPTKFISRKKIIKDLKFHIKLSNPPNQEVFLYDYEYEDYIAKNYGDTYYLDMKNIWEKLKLESAYKADEPDPVD